MMDATDLLPAQLTAIDQLRHYKVGALFMQPGTGKTRTAVELVRSVPEVDLVLWLAPYRSVHPRIAGTGIQDEVSKWGGLHRETVFSPIETLSSSDRTYLELTSRLEAAQCPFVVCDESLKIKNWDSIRTKRIIELGKLAQYRLVLNGTPLSKSLMDLWAQMEFLSPLILKMNLARYKKTFVEYTTMTKRLGQRTIRREWVNKYHNVEHLYNLIGHYVYEADLKLDVKQLMREVPYKVDQEARDEYKRLKEKYLDDEVMEARNNNIFLEMTQKMQHAYSTTADKFAKLDEVLKEHDPEKTIIFCKYVSSREACAKRYPKATVLSIQSEAMSLNLQERNVSVIFDKTWDFALIDQLKYRTYRTGQTEDCIYYSLTGDVPLEALIDKNVQAKMGLLEYFNSRSVAQLQKEL
jgi:hypothetical protein